MQNFTLVAAPPNKKMRKDQPFKLGDLEEDQRSALD